MSRSVAVLIATRDRAESLVRTLESLAEVDWPGDYAAQVVVVDNGSIDSTWQTLQEFRERSWPFDFIPVQQLTGGKSAALNAGLQRIRADVVLFTDDDMTFDRGWVEGFVRHFETCNCVGALGNTEPHCPEGWPNWFTPKLRVLFGDTSGVARSDGSVRELFGLNMAARGEAIAAVGGFDELLGPEARKLGYAEDVEWSNRLSQLGRLCYCSAARNIHWIPGPRVSKRVLWMRQLQMSRQEWLLRALSGAFRHPVSELLRECKHLAGAILIRRRRFEGFEYALELAGHVGRVYGLLEFCLRGRSRVRQ